MKSINEIEEEIIEEFAVFDNALDKFGYLIDVGKMLSPLDPQLKTDNRLIKGCQASVWIHSELCNGKVFFSADSNADYSKGMVALMIRVLSGHTPKEIINAPLNFIDKIGLKGMLSMKRSGGLESMIKQMKMDALAYSTKV